MLNFIMKVILIPIILIIASSFLPNLYYPHLFQPIIIGVTLAVAGHLLEWAVLREGTFWIATIGDFITSAVIIYFLSYFFFDADVTATSAVLTAALLTVIEFFVHSWLIRTGRARK
ncbi:MAG TPA: DUF2512 family protein [Bacillaceae bacterium]